MYLAQQETGRKNWCSAESASNGGDRIRRFEQVQSTSHDNWSRQLLEEWRLL
jgi:hypothetical protein